MKTLCTAYLIGLTWLLVVKDPLSVLGRQPGIGSLSLGLEPVAHLLSFALLAVLALVARWPVPRWALYLGLIGYGLATELLQSLLPWRTAQVADFLQDAGGVLTGGAVCWLAENLWRRGRLAPQERSPERATRSAGSEDAPSESPQD